jgi:hypothetical protein
MARREVVEVLCDRCKRVEMVPKDKAPPAGGEPVFSITLSGQSVSFTDLCTNCQKALAGYFKHCTLVKKDEAEQTKPEVVAKGGILSRLAAVKGGG